MTPCRRENWHTNRPETRDQAVARAASTAGHVESPAILSCRRLAGVRFSIQHRSGRSRCRPVITLRHNRWLRLSREIGRSVADSASPIELSRARRSGCSASCWPGCSFTVGVVASCWEVASLELAFASVAGCRSRMTARLRRSGMRSRSPARRSAAGYGCGIVIRERPLRQPSAELPGQCDDDALGAADVTQPVRAAAEQGTGNPWDLSCIDCFVKRRH